MKNKYDLIIIGAGPAGLTAAIYASRYGLSNVVLGTVLGGQASEGHKIDNYPGLEDITGLELIKKFEKHVKKYKTQIIPQAVVEIQKNQKDFLVQLGNGKKLTSRTVLIATGTKKRKLKIEEEEKFLGRGISYCATCDGFFYKNKTVAVIGGNDSAIAAAAYLAKIVKKLYLIYRGEKLRAETYWLDQIKGNGKIEIVCHAVVTAVEGKEKLETITINGEKKIKLDGLFIEIGSDPDLVFAKTLNLTTNNSGFVKVKKNGNTSVDGVWAAGDVTDGSDNFRQIITAAAEGAIAARSISNYLKNRK